MTIIWNVALHICMVHYGSLSIYTCRQHQIVIALRHTFLKLTFTLSLTFLGVVFPQCKRCNSRGEGSFLRRIGECVENVLHHYWVGTAAYLLLRSPTQFYLLAHVANVDNDIDDLLAYVVYNLNIREHDA